MQKLKATELSAPVGQILITGYTKEDEFDGLYKKEFKTAKVVDAGVMTNSEIAYPLDGSHVMFAGEVMHEFEWENETGEVVTVGAILYSQVICGYCAG